MQNTGEMATQLGNNWLQVISFFGILVTIAISYSSLNQQRNASARESLEQLDDVDMDNTNAKLRPLLYSYKNWPRHHATVKVKIYRTTEVAGLSKINHTFLGFPRHVLKGYSVTPISDGYLLDIDSADPAVIRQVADDFMQSLYHYSRQQNHATWLPLHEFKKNYYELPDEDLEELHKAILEYLESTEEQVRLQQIIDSLPGENKPNGGVVALAIRDLAFDGQVEESRNRLYQLSE